VGLIVERVPGVYGALLDSIGDFACSNRIVGCDILTNSPRPLYRTNRADEFQKRKSTNASGNPQWSSGEYTRSHLMINKGGYLACRAAYGR
jgi:hypothetical protein